jgi:hypothetical protein
VQGKLSKVPASLKTSGKGVSVLTD